MRRLFASLLLGIAAGPPLAASFAEPDTDRAPSQAAAAQLLEAAAASGWGEVAEQLREVSLSAYQQRRGGARSWYFASRWAELWSRSEAQAVRSWLEAIQRSGAGHARMPREYRLSDVPLGERWPDGLKVFALAEPAFSEAFFTLLTPEDSPGEVLSLLARMERADPVRFRRWWNLALAIAVVHDVPPPPGWPHYQVSPSALLRHWPAAEESFAFWARAEESGRGLLRLRSLGPEELKFVVDASAPLSELAWAREAVREPLSQFERLYDRLIYRTDRVETGAYLWPHQDYRLSTLLRQGGICVDQAYFAAQVGKAHGVPTLLFRGAGLDGRHAWFGFLSTAGWVLDAGRYAEQQYVAGTAYDPQTWREISDHALRFLSEGYRRLPSYRASQMHADFAREYLRLGQATEAGQAAAEATRSDARNLDAWSVLLETCRPQTRDYEGTLRRAALAFRRYPDLEAHFTRKLIGSLRARGESSRADHEERQLARKYQSQRQDLTVQQVAAMLQSARSEPLSVQIKTYQRLLAGFGYGGGIDFFDRVVRPFVESLRAHGAAEEAWRALESAQRTLRLEPGSQMHREMESLQQKLRPATR